MEQASGTGYNAQGDQIADPGQVAAILKRLQGTRTLLTTVVRGAQGQFNSMLLEVNAEKGYLILDELTPKEGHNHLKRSRQLRVFAQIRGVNINFAAQVEDISETAEGALYRLPMPASLYYLQRRAYFRVSVGRSTSFPISFTTEAGDSFRGYLVDISAGGVAARVDLPPDQVPALEVGEVLPSAVVFLDQGERFPCKLEVRFAVYREELKELHLGLRFADIDKAQQKRVERFVMTLQRERLKSMAR